MVSARRILSAIPIIAVSLLAVITVPAFLLPGDLISADDVEYDLSAFGPFCFVDVSADLRSGMVYDVSDLSISLSIEDQSNGKIVELIALDPITLEAGSTERVKASGMFFIPTLLLRLYNMVTSEGSVVHLVLRAEFGYMMGLMSLDLDTGLDLHLSEDGSTLSVSKVDGSSDSFTILIEGLRESLHPDDMDVELIGGTSVVSIAVRDEGQDVSVTVRTDGDLDAALSSISSSEERRVTIDGRDIGLSTERVDTLISVLNTVREWL